MKSQLLQQRSSRSLLSNVLDLQDDLLLLKHLAGVKIVSAARKPGVGSRVIAGSDDGVVKFENEHGVE